MKKAINSASTFHDARKRGFDELLLERSISPYAVTIRCLGLWTFFIISSSLLRRQYVTVAIV
jgi:hypothetical protein